MTAMKSIPKETKQIADDIRTMRTRGAGRIARAVVQGLIVAAQESKAKTKSAFLSDIGSLLEIKAPNVPILKPGTIGGIGIKNGREVSIPCFFETK